ncbi:DNA polymerase III subunit delta' [Sulfitobacter sabulilitoris]|uniref:DNA polymerase III subunit delta n=1 Tax=Sulfitobacter sabulilitoris TaxID=2562655 RepID=A0A5S3PB01_9RHOB|nr:DNA polymerase III subunit delta' [Sulfitobacter sabulilitoris]TMM50740.1 DNA polymerase III subunit delta' [Sulfitobacter sabulilitoris]
MSQTDHPAPDQIEGAPHPRDTQKVFGQAAAEAAFLEAYAAGRLHHAWLLTGPRGVGKATLAWSIARFLLATPAPQDDGMFGAPPPPASLRIDPEHPVARRIAARSEAGLKSVTRTVNIKTDRMRDVIVVDDIRALGQFFHMSATEGGRRVVIVDDADLMNTQAANALLKMLEEPPANATLLLISHQPSGLLPTIRSRCRTLRLGPLGPEDMQRALDQAGVAVDASAAALAEVSAGSVGAALNLTLLGGIQIYAELIAILGSMPQFDRARGLKLAEAAATRGAEARLDLLFVLLDLALSRLARTGATGTAPAVEIVPNEAAVLSRLAPSPTLGRRWAETAQEIGARARHGRAVNLDPAALVLDTVFKIQQTASG